jgi:hypothetical protein
MVCASHALTEHGKDHSTIGSCNAGSMHRTSIVHDAYKYSRAAYTLLSGVR